MRRKLIAIAATCSVVVGAGLVCSPPAQAVSSVAAWYVGCNAGSAALVLYDNGSTRTGNTASMTASVGDSVIIRDYTANPNIGCAGAPSPFGYALDILVNSSVVYSNTTADRTITFASGDTQISVRATAGTPANTYTVSVSGTGGGGGAPSGSSSRNAPQPVLQQFGKPATGDCATAAPIMLNWGGSASGGWGVSWAQWVNGGLGGAVCTRTLSYSQVSGLWSAA